MDNILTWSQAVLETTPNRWLKLTGMLPRGLLFRQPVTGEWSALECLGHLVDTEREVFPVRVEYLLEGRDFPAFDPDSEGTQIQSDSDPRQLGQEFDHLRQKSLVLFEKVSTSDLNRQARHSELGLITLSELLHEWAAHDLMHTVQAERALMQPFIAGCGPWKPYFEDHWVEMR